MVVYNMYAMTSSSINAPAVATVVEIVDNNTLLLSADIFPFSGLKETALSKRFATICSSLLSTPKT